MKTKSINFNVNRLLFISCFMLSCMPKASDEQIKSAKLHLNKFDSHTISLLPKYERLRIFFQTNADLLMSFQDSGIRLNNEQIRKERPDMKVVDRYPDCYNFSPHYQNPDTIKVPLPLQNHFNNLYYSIGKSNINTIRVCRNGEVVIYTKSYSLDGGLYISHCLRWTPQMLTNHLYRAHKDTLLTKDCIYRITLVEMQYQ